MALKLKLCIGLLILGLFFLATEGKPVPDGFFNNYDDSNEDTKGGGGSTHGKESKADDDRKTSGGGKPPGSGSSSGSGSNGNKKVVVPDYSESDSVETGNKNTGSGNKNTGSSTGVSKGPSSVHPNDEVIVNPIHPVEIHYGDGSIIKVPFPEITGNNLPREFGLRSGSGGTMVVGRPRQVATIPYRSWMSSSDSMFKHIRIPNLKF